jgi:hypothetical protein
LRLYRRANPDGNPRQLTSEAPGTPYGLAQPTPPNAGGDGLGLPRYRLMNHARPLATGSTS